MNTAMFSFAVLCSAVLCLLSLVAAGVAIAASVLHRSAVLRKELATRRILGARRTHVVRMFLVENVLGIATGLLGGGLALVVVSGSSRGWPLGALLGDAMLLVAATLIGGWIAARHASKVPFSASGLFRTSSDVRGQ